MQNFAEMSSIGKQHESVSVRFSRVALSYKLAQDMNLTRRENTSQHTNLLKEFQECITDQEAYPTAELTCSEYGMPRIRVSNNFSITIFRLYLYSYIQSLRAEKHCLRKREGENEDRRGCGVGSW